VVGELRDLGVLHYGDSKVFQILDDDLRAAYESASDKAPAEQRSDDSGELVDWIQKWIDMNEINASLEHLHFFIEGSDLLELLKRLMERAKDSLDVVNPFVDGHSLGTTLRDAAKRGVRVRLITRRPHNDKTRWAFHKTLLSEGVEMYYSGEGGSGAIHSKLVVVDKEVGIVSSMNFTKNSEVEAWETGIVTVENDTVASALQAISAIMDEPETRSADDIHK
jgi:phosphatidylserine/phosphatidylglycerophosphate/cardiolipin synthase-like enzyme